MRVLLAAWTIIFVAPIHAAAQTAPAPPRGPEVFVKAGIGHLFRAQDQTFGDELDVGGGVGFRAGRVGVEFELHRLVGLTPDPVSCAVSVPCVGEAREGVLAATLVSGNVFYYFKGDRAQPFLTGGVGALRSTMLTGLIRVGPDQAEISETRMYDTGVALNVGVGVRVRLTRTVWLRPEVRSYSSSIKSRQNLGLIRGTVAVGYLW
jgi:hypothetical protein